MAAYNIKLSSYSGEVGGRPPNNGKEASALSEEMTGVNLRHPGLLISLKLKKKAAADNSPSRVCDLQRVTHLSTDSRAEMWFQSVLLPHR